MFEALQSAESLVAERLQLESSVATELRSQHAILTRVAGEIESHIAALTTGSDGTWRSPSQREFARACDDLDGLLRSAWTALEQAAAGIERDLAGLRISVSVGG